MRRHFSLSKRVGLLASAFSKDVAAAIVDRHSALKIGQREINAAIPAKGRAEQREQRLILVNGQQFPPKVVPSSENSA